MTQTVTREKLLQDFNAVIAETEVLLKDAATMSGDKANAIRGDIEVKLRTAREKLVELEHAAIDRAKAAATATDDFVHDRPWQAIGITAGVGVLVGITIGLLLNRHR